MTRDLEPADATTHSLPGADLPLTDAERRERRLARIAWWIRFSIYFAEVLIGFAVGWYAHGHLP